MDLSVLRKLAHDHGAKVILDTHLPSYLSSDLAIEPPNKAEILSLLDNISLQREDGYHATVSIGSLVDLLAVLKVIAPWRRPRSGIVPS